MKRGLFGATAFALFAISAIPAVASTATCGNTSVGGIFIDVSVASGTPTCGASGTGTLLATGSDPSGLNILDTTQTGVNGTPELTVTFDPPLLPNAPRTDGNFSFDPTGYMNFVLGFQFRDKGFLDPNPDWILVALPDPAGGGSFDADFNALFVELPSDAIAYVVLYGNPAPGQGPGETPVPGAVWLLGSALAGGASMKKLIKKKPEACKDAVA